MPCIISVWYYFPAKCAPTNDNWTCCTSSSQCGHGEGDCDYDSDCAGDLVCGTNNCADGVSGLDCCEGKLTLKKI